MATETTTTTTAAAPDSSAAAVPSPAPAPAPVAAASTPATPAPASGTPDLKANAGAPADAQPKTESLLKPTEQEKKDGTADGQPPKGTPAEISVTVPEGVKVNPAILDEFKTLARDSGLTSENAQKLFGLGLKMQEALAADLDQSLEQYKRDSIATLRKEWGAQFDANVQAAKKVVGKFGDPKLLEELSGLENSPAVMRTLAAIGRAMGEDSIAIKGAFSAPPPRGASTGNSTVDAMANDPGFYPSMHKGAQ